MVFIISVLLFLFVGGLILKISRGMKISPWRLVFYIVVWLFAFGYIIVEIPRDSPIGIIIVSIVLAILLPFILQPVLSFLYKFFVNVIKEWTRR